MMLSIVVIFHNMRREADRTLLSLAPSYQTGVTADAYEVIAIDNGPSVPLDQAAVIRHGSNFNYRHFATNSVSPVEAVNAGAEIASGERIAVIVDGARMATPGLVANTLHAAAQFPHPFVCALAFHLGPDVQNDSIEAGYDQEEEDRLLESIDWSNNGYELFGISTLAKSSRPGFLGGMPTECSWLAMRRATFLEMGGFDERFQQPGGGLVNQDFRNRAVEPPEVSPIVLLGEGLFHQIHGGVATNVPSRLNPIKSFHAEYRQITGVDYQTSPTSPVAYFGQIPDSARRFISHNTE